MKFSILGFSQKELIKHGMDVIDALILRYFVDFKDSTRMDKEEIGDKVYYWLKYDGIREELPILNLKKDTIYRRLKNMVKNEVLIHETIRENGVYSYYGIGSNFVNLISDFNSKTSEKNTEPYENKSTTLTEKSPEQKINLLKDPSTKDLNNIYSLVVEYLNERASKKYKCNSKKTQQLIRGKMKEGFALEDFYKVIDNKVEEWAGSEMEKYLRPETLFGSKFEGYLNQKSIEKDYEEVEEDGLGFTI